MGCWFNSQHRCSLNDSKTCSVLQMIPQFFWINGIQIELFTLLGYCVLRTKLLIGRLLREFRLDFYIYIYICIMVRGSFTQSLGPITWRRHPQSWHWKLGLHRTAQFQRRIWHRVKSCHQHALCWVILQILARSYHAPYHTICMSFSQSGANASKQTELPKMPNSVAEPI